MSQSPITVTYSLEEVLGEIKQSIKEVNQKLEKIDERLTKIEVNQAELSTEVKGIDNRLKAVEGTQKNQVWALILLLAGAIATAGARVFLTGNP